jgi:hypothetical protein
MFEVSETMASSRVPQKLSINSCVLKLIVKIDTVRRRDSLVGATEDEQRRRRLAVDAADRAALKHLLVTLDSISGGEGVKSGFIDTPIGDVAASVM